MQADRRARQDARDDRNPQGKQTLIIIVAAVILVAGAFLLLPGDDQETPAAEQPIAVEAPQPPQPDPAENITAAPDIPEPEPQPEPELEVDTVAEAPPPPTPEEIDAQIRNALAEATSGPDALLAPALAAPFLLDRGVSAIDQVARGYVPLRALNISRPKGRFAVRREGQQHFVDETSYARYDAIVESLTSLSPDALAGGFQRFRALLSNAYAALGYPADAVDNATIAALDQILAAPVIRAPIKLESKGALWAYSDSGLESRSDLHKQLMRVGPDNLEILQRWAQDLRTALLQ